MRNQIFLLLFFFSFLANATFAQDMSYVKIGINGLHCSACTFSVEKSLRRLDFVRVVQMDLNKRSGLVYLKEGVPIDFEKIAKAVEGAGFSVRSFQLIFKDELDANQTCYFENICVANAGTTSGSKLKLIDKLFVEKKSRAQYKAYLAEDCPTCDAQEKKIKAIVI